MKSIAAGPLRLRERFCFIGVVPRLLTYCRNKIIADPEKCFQELISEKLMILLRDRPCLELIIVYSNFQALLFLQDKVLES